MLACLSREILMATERYPNQNVNMPMDPNAVQAVRDRTAPKQGSGVTVFAPADGKGSRRQVRPGEWVDDRRIVLDGKASPSHDSPPELKGSGKALPASYDPLKVY